MRQMLYVCLFMGGLATAQETPLAWNATPYFQFNIDNVVYDSSTGNVKVIFSVANPKDPARPFWNIKTDPPFTSGAASRLRIDIGWDTSDYTNTGSNNGSLNPIVQPATLGSGAAMPAGIANAITAATACTGAADCPGVVAPGHYWAQTKITPLRFPNSQTLATGVVGLEGHPGCNPTAPATVLASVCPAPTVNATTGALTYANVPAKSVVRYFSLNGGPVTPRREVVDINKCKGCHDNNLHNGKVIPRLSLHGANRNEELGLCVICHNPNNTDIPYRTSGREVSIDFKRMIHSIHSGGFRKTPYSVVGFQGTVYDFSVVRFPSELRNCTRCHIDNGTKGTFELPVKAMGSTINTGSVLGSGLVDADPNNDLKISPTAATCSGCHDSSSVQSHMVRTGGASFGATQQNLTAERCANCHGAGREESVRKAHEIRSGSSSSKH